MGAAIGPNSTPRRAVREARTRDVFALSQQVWAEIIEVLHRPRLARFIDPGLRDELLDWLDSAAMWFEPRQSVTDCRDAKDNKYFELALAAGASAIVSSDEDLLFLHPWRGVRVVRPAEYLARL